AFHQSRDDTGLSFPVGFQKNDALSQREFAATERAVCIYRHEISGCSGVVIAVTPAEDLRAPAAGASAILIVGQHLALGPVSHLVGHRRPYGERHITKCARPICRASSEK